VNPIEETTFSDLLSDQPWTLSLATTVLVDWPEHAAYLRKSFQARPPTMMRATEKAASAIVKLIDGRAREFAADYHWTCDRLREEELFFHREGRYRLQTFAQALAEVYSDADYMRRYVNGLLLTQALWFNHAATFEMFLSRVIGGTENPFDYLEVGPGHGLMVYFAAVSPLCRHLEGWDVSEVSLRETGEALRRLGVARPVALTKMDIMQAAAPDRRYDLIVISEVLEHLEHPDRALRFLRSALTGEGRIFINVPLNSPSPDHIFLLSSPEDVRSLLESAGLRIVEMELFATQGRKIERALANRVSVSAGVIACPS
jgi:2-polyprenyl-3-methyl-5-hydroxy-6-metoxy-1,4-benzoquinol methylase